MYYINDFNSYNMQEIYEKLPKEDNLFYDKIVTWQDESWLDSCLEYAHEFDKENSTKVNSIANGYWEFIGTKINIDDIFIREWIERIERNVGAEPAEVSIVAV